VAVLHYEASRNNYPGRYWSRLFADWPKDSTPQQLKLFAHSGVKLPPAIIVECRHELTNWFVEHYKALDQLDRKMAHQFFDHVVDARRGANANALRSSLVKASVGGVEIPSNRLDLDYAINAPTGHLADALFGALDARELQPRRRLPVDIRLRLETLLNLPEEGGWHALAVVARQSHYLYWIDRRWTRTFLLPRFDPNTAEAEAAWSGYLGASQLAQPELFKDMREHFLAAFAAIPHWAARGIERLGQHLLLAVEGPPSNKAYVTADQARTALRSANSAVRLEALSTLQQRATESGAWKRIVVPFFRDVWPRERQFQTAETSRALALFLAERGEQFPDGVRLVADFLVSSPDIDIVVYQFGRDRENGHRDLATRYPHATLTLFSRIIDERSPRAPYGLAEITTHLAEAAPELRQDERWRRLHKMTQ
jgi:hypothetical protein